METIALLVGGAAGVVLRVLLTANPANLADALPRRRSFVITGVGALLLGVATGVLVADPHSTALTVAIGLGLSCGLLTFCLFSDATLLLMRGARQMLNSAIVQMVIGFIAATAGVTLGALMSA
jgi:fluoride ion exporter CrcB/FEX